MRNNYTDNLLQHDNHWWMKKVILKVNKKRSRWFPYNPKKREKRRRNLTKIPTKALSDQRPIEKIEAIFINKQQIGLSLKEGNIVAVDQVTNDVKIIPTFYYPTWRSTICSDALLRLPMRYYIFIFYEEVESKRVKATRSRSLRTRQRKETVAHSWEGSFVVVQLLCIVGLPLCVSKYQAIN